MERLVRAYLADGGAARRDALADGVVLRHPWGEFRGADAVMAVDEEIAAGFADRDVEVTALFTRDGRAVARTAWRGTHTGAFRGAAPTGKRVEVVTFYDVEAGDGGIESIVAVNDSLHVFQQLGLFPPPGSLPAPIAYAALLRQKLFRDHGARPAVETPSGDGLNGHPASAPALLRRLVGALYVDPDPDEAAALLDDEVTVHYHTSSVPMRGRDALWAIVDNLRDGFPDMTLIPRVVLGDGREAIHVSAWVGTQTGRFQGIPPTGRRVKVDVASHARIREGRVVELETVLDAASVLYQLGMLPRLDPIPRPMRPLLRLRAKMQRST